MMMTVAHGLTCGHTFTFASLLTKHTVRGLVTTVVCRALNIKRCTFINKSTKFDIRCHCKPHCEAKNAPLFVLQ